MNDHDLQELLIDIFSALRRNGSTISISELLDGLRVTRAIARPDSLPRLRETLRLLWGAEEGQFKPVWESQLARYPSLTLATPKESPLSASVDEAVTSFLVREDNPLLTTEPQPVLPSGTIEAGEQSNASGQESEVAERSAPSEARPEHVDTNGRHDSFKTAGPSRGNPRRGPRGLGSPPPKFIVKSDMPGLMPTVGALPIKVPSDLQPFSRTNAIYAYKPISRLSMAYAWRYLRRPVPDGPANILDVEATITLATRQGFFLTPVYRRRHNNHAHLMLLIDQAGSMSPFRSITEDLIETAWQENSIKQIEVSYFHNFFDDGLYADEYLTEWSTSNHVLECCTTNTSILVVSDAGAARGFVNPERIRKTAQMLSRLRQQTNLLAWLNPMPRVRWSDSSAQAIAEEVQMFQFDVDGFSNVIDALQGRGIAS
jgi:uncharacterized protein with von Willebrand factor type A (vWA) domain